MYKYCTCGEKTLYVSQPPSFCSYCAQPFGQIIAPQLQKSPSKSSIFKSESDIYNGDNADDAAKLEELKAFISEVTLVENRRPSRAIKQQETIRDIWGTEAFNGSRPNPVKGKKLSNKKILEDFVKEATPRGRSNPIEITDKGEI